MKPELFLVISHGCRFKTWTILQRAGSEWNNWDKKWCPYGILGLGSRRLACYINRPEPSNWFLQMPWQYRVQELSNWHWTAEETHEKRQRQCCLPLPKSLSLSAFCLFACFWLCQGYLFIIYHFPVKWNITFAWNTIIRNYNQPLDFFVPLTSSFLYPMLITEWLDISIFWNYIK